MTKAPLIAIYPGTFDPITRGHLHMIRRASHIVDRLIVSVSASPRKSPLFTMEERVSMAQSDIETIKDALGCKVEVRGFDNLLIHHARDCGARYIVRGLRAVSDFEYEFNLTGMNAHLDSDIETLFLMAGERWQFISSSFVKEIAMLGGDVKEFATIKTAKHLAKRAQKNPT